MRHIKSINELFGIGDRLKGIFKDGESTAKGILASLADGLNIESKKQSRQKFLQFNIDDFNIKLFHGSSSDRRYELSIDDVKIDATNYICKNIFKKCIEIMCKEEKKKEEEISKKKKEEEDWIKRDAKIHFRKR